MLGGVPTGKVRYDNLKAAVSAVLGFTRARMESARWTAFREHYGVEAFYCQPGIKGAHEKGGVEGDIGWFRRNHLVPIPEVGSLDELNEMIDRWDEADEGRRIGARARTVGEYFVIERPLLRTVSQEPFETGLLLPVRVDRYSQITVRTNRYSAPARFIGRQLRVMLHASHLIVYDGQQVVAEHDRLFAKGGRRLELDHYLEALIRKPGALPGATARSDQLADQQGRSSASAPSITAAGRSSRSRTWRPPPTPRDTTAEPQADVGIAKGPGKADPSPPAKGPENQDEGSGESDRSVRKSRPPSPSVPSNSSSSGPARPGRSVRPVQVAMDELGVEEDEARQIVVTVQRQHAPRNLAGYLTAMARSGDLADLARSARTPSASRPAPPPATGARGPAVRTARRRRRPEPPIGAALVPDVPGGIPHDLGGTLPQSASPSSWHTRG
ncbi:Mu transposase domain-containing protein [Actinomadura sp. ATCC 39365]